MDKFVNFPSLTSARHSFPPPSLSRLHFVNVLIFQGHFSVLDLRFFWCYDFSQFFNRMMMLMIIWSSSSSWTTTENWCRPNALRWILGFSSPVSQQFIRLANKMIAPKPWNPEIAQIRFSFSISRDFSEFICQAASGLLTDTEIASHLEDF